MPNRVIWDGLKTDPHIDKLSWFEEVFFYRLLLTVDDFGCYDGRPIVLKNSLFPSRDDIAKKHVEKALETLSNLCLVEVYTVDGMPYVHINGFEKHQRLRKVNRKYPAPPSVTGETHGSHLTALAPASDCQVSALVPAIDGQLTVNCQSSDSNLPLETKRKETETETEVELETETKGASAAEKRKATVAAKKAAKRSEDEKRPVVPDLPPIPLNDNTGYYVKMDDFQKWKALYPAVDVAQEIRKMVGWADSHPTKRKTYDGTPAFINSWLSRTQNEGGSNGYNGGNNYGQNGGRGGPPQSSGPGASGPNYDAQWGLHSVLEGL